MRILMGTSRHDRSAVRVLGHVIPEEQASAKRDVGFVSEDMRLHGNVSLAWLKRCRARVWRPCL
jgi:ABC-2 type transport system ATP-binding protein